MSKTTEAPEKISTKPVPVRLNQATRERLDRAAERMSSNRCAVIRLAIYQLLPEIESGKIALK